MSNHADSDFMDEELPDSIDPIEPLRKESQVVLRSKVDDAKLNSEVRVAQMLYSQHEFVKTIEVGKLINEALEQIFERLQKKDKVIG